MQKARLVLRLFPRRHRSESRPIGSGGCPAVLGRGFVIRLPLWPSRPIGAYACVQDAIRLSGSNFTKLHRDLEQRVGLVVRRSSNSAEWVVADLTAIRLNGPFAICNPTLVACAHYNKLFFSPEWDLT